MPAFSIMNKLSNFRAGKKMKNYAVLLAAGTGSRTGAEIPKQLIKINGKEIILLSLEIFLKSKINFEAVVVATPPPSVFKFDWNNFFKKNLVNGEIEKLRIITGGETRQQSVDNSIKYLKNIISPAETENTVVFIHDSARPFVKDEELHLLFKHACAEGAAFLCSEVTETIKEISNGEHSAENRAEHNAEKTGKVAQNGLKNANLKLKTLKRAHLISAKTPQVFRFEIIKKALEKAAEENFISTDDVSLVENLGLTAVPVKSTDFNIKITSAVDIGIAEFFLSRFCK